MQVDFSKQGTKKALMRETLGNPLTMYSFGIGLLGLLGIILFGFSWITVGCTVFFLIASCITWSVNYFVRSEIYVRRHLESIQKILEDQKKQLTSKIGQGLSQLKTKPGSEELLRQAKAQFPLVEKNFEAFKSLLGEKFSPQEITYSRYLGAAEQIYLSILDQLDHVLTLFKSLETTDLNHAKNRLAELEKKGSQISQDDIDEKKALEMRVNLAQKNLKEIDIILSKNEEAITSLEFAKAAIASVKTSKGQSSTELSDAMRDLEDLTQRSKQYSINHK